MLAIAGILKRLQQAIAAIDPYLNYVVLNVNSNSTLNATNNTFLDDGFTGLSASGNVTQGTFSPFSPAGWSVYFDGVLGTGLSATNNSAFDLSNSDFTIEYWICTNTTTQYSTTIAREPAAWAAGMWSMHLNKTAGSVDMYVYDYNTGSPMLETTGVTVNDNKWHHIAVVRSGSSFTLYVDGTSRATATWAGTIGTVAGGNITIGRSQNNNNVAYNGYISNVRIVKGTALYTGAFTVPTSPLLLVQNTSLLTLQDNRFKDNSSNNIAMVASGTVNIQPFSPFAPRVDYAPATHGGSAYFSGTDNTTYIEVFNSASNSSTYLRSNNFTMECWVYVTSFAASNNIATKYKSGAGEFPNDQFQWVITSNTSIYLGLCYNGNNESSNTFSGSTLATNVWHHIAMVRNGNNLYCYVNGNQYGNVVPFSGTVNDGIYNYIIGNRYDKNDQKFSGYISNLRITNGTALYTVSPFTPPTAPVTASTNTSLLLNFTNGGVIDRSYKTDLTLFGNAKISTAQSKYGGGSLYFSGAASGGDSAKISYDSKYDFGGTGAFTIECWFYALVIDSNPYGILSKGGGAAGWNATDGHEVAISISTDNKFYIQYNSSGAVVSFVSPSVVTANTWNHAAFVFDGTTYTAYLNGTSIGSNTYALKPLTLPTNRTLFYVGRLDSTDVKSLNGYIDDVRYTKGVARYTGTFTPPQRLTATAADPYFQNVVLFLDGDSIGSAVNNQFRADSGDAARLAVTRNGTVTQGSFSPYSPNGWSGTFVSSISSYITAPPSSTLNFGTGDFTIECWVNFTDTTGNKAISDASSSPTGSGVSGRYFLYKDNSGNLLFGAHGTGALISYSWSPTVGVWYHIAVTRIGGLLRMYVNGNSVGTPVSNNTTSFTADAIQIGVVRTPYFFDGYISNFRIVNGTALYTSNFTPTTSPLQAIPNTSLLTLQDNRFKDNSTNNLTLTATGSVSIQAFNPFKNTTAYSPTLHGGSAYFGSGNYLSSTNSQLNLSLGNYTVEFWMYNTTSGASNILHFTSDAAVIGTSLYLNASNQLIIDDGNTAGAVLGTIPNYIWNHIAISKKGTTTSIYLNGILLGTSTYTPTSNTSLYVGGFHNANNTVTANYNGYISNLRIVNGTALYTSNFTPTTAPLSAVNGTSLLLNFANGGIVDSSGNSDIVTVGNVQVSNVVPSVSASTSIGTLSAGSMYFDGSSYVTIPDSALWDMGSSNFTAECRVYLTSSAVQQIILGQWSGSTGSNTLNFALMTSNDANRYVRYTISSNGSAVANDVATTTAIPLNTWCHIALVRNGSNFNVYLNGVACTGGSLTSSATLYNATNNFSIGGNSAGGQLFSGYIDDVRITKGVARYTQNFSVPTFESPVYNQLTYPSDPYFNYTTLLINGDTVTNEQNNTFKDSSSNNLTITRSGTVTQGSFTPYNPNGWSGLFNGGTDGLTITNSSVFELSNSNFTIEYWINTKDATQYTTTIAREPAAWGQGMWSMHLNRTANAGNVDMYVYEYSNGSPILDTSGVVVNDNQWHHIAVVRNSSTFTLYVDGSARATNTWSGTISGVATGGNVTIGKSEQLGRNFNGYISNVRITKGQALYTSTFTPPSAALTTTSSAVSSVTLSAQNVSLLTLQNNRFVDNSNNGLTITPNGTVSIQQFSPFAPTSAYSPTLYGGSGWFNTSDYLNVASNAAFAISNNWTIDCWYYATNKSSSTYPTIFDIATSGTDRIGLFDRHTNSNTKFRLTIGATEVAGTTTVANNTWYHLALVSNAGSVILYVNGIADTTAQSLSTASSNRAVWLGRDYANSSSSINGYISNFRIVNGTAIVPPIGGYSSPTTAVSGTSLLLNFTNGGVIDATGKNNITTAGTAKVDYTSNTLYGTGCLKFDGTANCALSTQSSQMFNLSSTNWTVETWVYSLSTNNAICSLYNSSSDKITLSSSSAGNLIYNLNEVNVLSTSSPIPLSSWNHLALVKNGANTLLYCNGLSAGSTTSVPSNTVKTAYIGFDPNVSNSNFNGYIDEFRITNGIARYTTNFALPSSAALPYNEGDSVKLDYLIVAGGGGGGYGRGGGGGAGGISYSTNTIVSRGTYTVTVGAGGSGGTNGTGTAANGSNSVFGIFSAIGGGGGANQGGVAKNGAFGGSGGGGVTDSSTGTNFGTGGSGVYSRGNTGGNSAGSPNYPGGGGGGAGSRGEDATTTIGGRGGAGSNAYATWASATSTGVAGYYAGGGGGGNYSGGTAGVGGSGGGGSSVNSAVGTAGAANTGGGGGAGFQSGDNITYYNGGAGGSGIVILRYAGTQRATGGTVTSSGGYTYHTFTTIGTSTFTLTA